MKMSSNRNRGSRSWNICFDQRIRTINMKDLFPRFLIRQQSLPFTGIENTSSRNCGDWFEKNIIAWCCRAYEMKKIGPTCDVSVVIALTSQTPPPFTNDVRMNRTSCKVNQKFDMFFFMFGFFLNHKSICCWLLLDAFLFPNFCLFFPYMPKFGN